MVNLLEFRRIHYATDSDANVAATHTSNKINSCPADKSPRDLYRSAYFVASSPGTNHPGTLTARHKLILCCFCHNYTILVTELKKLLMKFD